VRGCPFELTPDWALFCGEAVLPTPEGGSIARPLRIQLLPDGEFYRGAASSFGLAARVEARVSFAELRRAGFVFGDVHEARFIAPEGRDHAAWRGYFAFDPRWVAAEAAGARTAVDRWLGIRRPAADPSVGLLFASSTAVPQPHITPLYRGALVQAGPSAIWSLRERIDLTRIFVQRTIGAALSLDRPGASWWFGDGVAHAVALRVLVGGGFISIEEVAVEVSQLLAVETLSPWAGSSLGQLAHAARGTEGEQIAARRLLAVRGALLGLALDRASDHALQRALRQMLRRLSSNGASPPSADELFESAAAAGASAASAALRTAFEQGDPIPLRAADLSPCLAMVRRQVHRFELGFEQWTTELGDARVTRVDPRGPAARAGLQVDDTILRVDYAPDAPDVPVELEVRRRDGTMRLRYLPRGRSLLGRAVSVRSRSGSCRLLG
jgi:hypothetical protein